MLHFDDFMKDYLKPFNGCKYFYDSERGFIVWRTGTGLNVELLHVRAFRLRQGFGRVLVHHMLDCLNLEGPPYYSVYGFTRVSNERAIEFYHALGFQTQHVVGLYKDGEAVMFWQDFDVLMEAMDEDRVRREALDG